MRRRFGVRKFMDGHGNDAGEHIPRRNDVA